MSATVEDADGNPHNPIEPSGVGIDAAEAVVDRGVPGATACHAVLRVAWDGRELAGVRQAFEAELTAAMPGISIGAARCANARWIAPNLTGY